MCIILHKAFSDFTVSNIFIFRDNIVMRTHILPGFDQILSLRDKKNRPLSKCPLFFNAEHLVKFKMTSFCYTIYVVAEV